MINYIRFFSIISLIAGGLPILSGIAAADDIEVFSKQACGAIEHQELTGGSGSNIQNALDNLQGSQPPGVPVVLSAPVVPTDLNNRLFHGDYAYLSLSQLLSGRGWVGDIKKYTICDNPNTCDFSSLPGLSDNLAADDDNKNLDFAQSQWSTEVDGGDQRNGGAGEDMSDYINRKVYTYLGNQDVPLSPVTLDEYMVSNSEISFKDLGGNATGLSSTDSRLQRERIMEWFRGKDVKDEDGDGVVLETRASVFAGPLHSRPSVIRYEKHVRGDVLEKIVVGLSDGTVRMLDANTGVEDFSYVAPETLSIHRSKYEATTIGGVEGREAGRVYGMDGTPQVLAEDADGDGTMDKHTLIIGMRRGGSNYHALDISLDDNGSITPKFLWRIVAGDTERGYGKLGQTWSAPLPVSLRVEGDSTVEYGEPHRINALVFGAGYDSTQDSGFKTSRVGNGLYIVDPIDGSKLLSIGGPGFGADIVLPGMSYPVPGDLSPIDSDGDGFVDRIYFADTGGQIWRVDLSASLGKSTGGRLAILSNADFPEGERRFYEPPEVTPIVDISGISQNPEFDIISIASGYRAHPHDMVVEDRLYSIRDYLVGAQITLDKLDARPTNYPMCTGVPSLTTCEAPLAESNLLDVTENLIQVGSSRESSDEMQALGMMQGWFIRFGASSETGDLISGEKGLAKTTVIDGALIATTYTPRQTCEAGAEPGTGRLYAVDLLTGEALFDDYDGIDGLDTTDRSKNIGRGIPSSAIPVFQETGVTLLTGTSSGVVVTDPLITPPVSATFWYKK